MESRDGEFVGLWQLTHGYVAHFCRVSVCRGSGGVAGGPGRINILEKSSLKLARYMFSSFIRTNKKTNSILSGVCD